MKNLHTHSVSISLDFTTESLNTKSLTMFIMEKRQISDMLFLYRRIKKRKRNTRLHWVHLILTKRVEFGAFYTLFPNLREHEDKFSNYFRMSTTSFDKLHLNLKDCIQRQDTFIRECIQPVQMLAITLR